MHLRAYNKFWLPVDCVCAPLLGFPKNHNEIRILSSSAIETTFVCAYCTLHTDFRAWSSNMSHSKICLGRLLFSPPVVFSKTVNPDRSEWTGEERWSPSCRSSQPQWMSWWRPASKPSVSPFWHKSWFIQWVIIWLRFWDCYKSFK